MTTKDRVQIALLIPVACVVAFALQNFEGWHAKYVLSEIEPEIVSGEITSINVVPSNTTTNYSVSVDVAPQERATLIVSLAQAKSCTIGQEIRLEKRGLDYRLSKDGCEHE